MGFPYLWVNTRCANNGRTYTIPIPWQIYLVVRYASYLFSIFMNIDENLRNVR